MGIKRMIKSIIIIIAVFLVIYMAIFNSKYVWRLFGFMACEDTYICVAFDDLEKDRRYFIDRHKQENERIISDKTVIAKTISFIPLCGVIILKLIIPFVLYGMSALQTTDLMM